jgi:cell division protein FtsB
LSDQQAAVPAQQGLLDRLATAEAQLARLGGLEAQLQQAQASVAALEGQNARLQTGACWVLGDQCRDAMAKHPLQAAC